jgi:serpin B
MKRNLAGAVRNGAIALLAVLPLLGATPGGPPPVKTPEITRRINAFTLDFITHLAERDDGNVIVSPQSIFHGLAMSYVASGGETRSELAKAMLFPDDDEQLMADLAWTGRQLRDTARHKGIDLRIANSAWLDSRYAEFRKEYRDKLVAAFGACLQSAEFKDPAKACKRINKWISENTKGKIKKGIGPGDLKSRSAKGVINEPALVTVNAVYFKSDWFSRFDKNATRERPFHLDADTKGTALFMHQRSQLRYSENANFKFLELPYRGKRCAMYVLLPKEILSVKKLISGASVETVAQLKNQAVKHKVDVLFPKFEIGSRCSVKAVLADMGVKAAFDSEKADFDSMIVKKLEAFRIYLSEVHHDAWIDVHEDGTEAAAATTSTHYSIACSAPPRPRRATFHADRPFLFLIVDSKTQAFLLAGWMADPKKIETP